MSTTESTQQNRDRELTFQIQVRDRSFDFDDQKLKMVPGENPEFIEGYWTKDKAGKEHIEKAVLGDTVYFHVKTKGLSDGREITLQLFEQDTNFGLDWVDPDDDEFPNQKIIEKARVKANKATVELLLEESWEGMIKDDHDNAFSLDQRLELYWKVSYKNKNETELPTADSKYLSVGQNDRSLYIKPFQFGYKMPEFFDYDGNPLAHLKIGVNNAIDTQVKQDAEKRHAKEVANHAGVILKDQAISGGTQLVDKKISDIALARFDKATLAAKNAPYSANLLNDIYTQDPKIIEQLKHNDFKKVIKGNGVKTLEFYGKSGVKMNLLGFMKNAGSNAGTALDLFDVFKFGMSDGLDFNNPLSFPGVGALGPVGAAFSLVNGVAGMLVKQIKDEQDAELSADIQKQVNKAKLKGLDATRAEVNSWNTSLNTWQFENISKVTANKFLAGDFQTMSELRASDSEIMDNDYSVTLLLRAVKNENKEMKTYIVETVFFEI